MSSLPRDDAVRYPVRQKWLLGLPAFFTGYVLTYLRAGSRLHSILAATTVRDQGTTIIFTQYLTKHGVTVPTWKGVGWVFYDAHLSPFRGVDTLDLIGAADGNLELLYAVPPVTLIAAGSITASDSYGRTIWNTGSADALIFLSYFPLAVIGRLLSVVSVSVSIRPEPAYSIFPWSAVHSIVFGPIGGGLMHEVHERTTKQDSIVAA